MDFDELMSSTVGGNPGSHTLSQPGPDEAGQFSPFRVVTLGKSGARLRLGSACGSCCWPREP